ncbi:MAG: hypothetical protein ACOC2F_08060, partial [Bacteroidota bacterium]
KLAEIFSRHIQTSREYTNIFKLVDSRVTENRILAANMIGSLKDPKLISQLVLLLKDFRPEVKKAAFIAATNYRTSDLSPIMLEHLASTENYAYAYDVLLRIGEDGLEYLEKAFLNPKTDDRLLKRIVKLIGEFKSLRAQKLLLSKIDYTSPEVSFQAIGSLIEGGFEAKDADKYRVLNAIVKIIGAVSKNMNLLYILKGQKTDPSIIDAIRKDNQVARQNIFDLLSIVYNRNIILRLKEYIENEDLTANHFGLELLDNILDENIKSVLVPTLQFNSPYHKVKTLQYFYVLEEIPYDEAFDQMLVAESSQTSNYTKACILNYYLSLDEVKINDVIVSCLFHKDRLIQETAACLIYKNDVDLYYEVVERLDVNAKYYLDNSVEFYQSRKSHLLLSKINFLYKIPYFNSLRSTILVELAKYLEINSLKESGNLTFEGEPWRYPIMFIESGRVDLVHDEHIIFTISENNIIDFGMFHHNEDNKFTLYPKEDTVFYSISREFLNLQIFDFPELEVVFQKIMNDFYETYKNFKKLPQKKMKKPVKLFV